LFFDLNIALDGDDSLGCQQIKNKKNKKKKKKKKKKNCNVTFPVRIISLSRLNALFLDRLDTILQLHGSLGSINNTKTSNKGIADVLDSFKVNKS